jgi:predicted transcriptional regulator of viral defense system
MEFERLLELVGDEPLFETSLLLAGEVNPAVVRLQLSRWTKSGKLRQLRRGLYALAPPYQKVKPHPFLLANRMQRGSYVSCQSALAHYGLIPEYVPVTVSVGAGRPGYRVTALGAFQFHHLKPELLRGYLLTELPGGQQALVASPAKALLDLLYLTPESDSRAYLHELRLQNLECLDAEELRIQAEAFAMPKIERAVEVILELRRVEIEEYELL